MGVYYLIEYRSIFLMICSDIVIVSVGCNDVHLVKFSCELLTWYIFQNLLNYCWFYYFISKDTYISTVSGMNRMIKKSVACWLLDILNVVMFTVLRNNENRSTSWWGINSYFKYTIFDEGVIWLISFNVRRMEIFMPFISS